MRVLINDFILGDRGIEGPNQFRVSPARLSQEVNPIRADYASFLDRGNKRKQITFSVTKQHKSYAAAEIYILDHDEVVPTQGLVTFECAKDGGGLIKRYIANAMLEALECSHLGVSTFHTYQIKGGKIADKKP